MKKISKKGIFAIIAIIVLIGFWVAPVITGLTKEAMMFLGVFFWTLIMLAVNVLSMEITMLISLGVIVATGICPFATTFSQYSGTTVWLLIAVFGFGTAVANSGLLARLALHIMKLFPQTYNGRLLATMTAGAIISPLVPNLSAKAVIMCPIAGALGDEAGYAPKSKGQAGLFMGAYISSGMFGNTWLTGSLGVPLVLMFIEPMSWFGWLSATWLWGLIILVGMFFFLRFYYDPKDPNEKTQKLSKEEKNKAINDRIAALGPFSKKEIITALVLVASMVMWMTESYHGVSTVIVTLLAFCVLAVCGLFNTMDFMTKVAWPLIIMVGAILGLTSVMSYVGINDWISGFLGPVILKVASNPYILVTVIYLISAGLWMLFINMVTTMMVITAVFTPIAATVGINPFVPMFVAMIAAQLWVWKAQSSSLLAGLGVMGDRVDHPQTVPSSIAWFFIDYVACMASIPVWHLIGFIA